MIENNNPTIAIIISAYNAEKYIKEQVESILNQVDVNVFLWIRNDGSVDRTLEILRTEFGTDSRVVVTDGDNLGAAESFLQAIFECDYQCQYYGFSDADDVWVANKLKLSIEKIKISSSSNPIAVATQMKVVDQNLQTIGLTDPPRIGLKFNNAVVQTVASGASILMNQSAFSLLRSYRPKSVVMHDAWIYLLITAFGNFLYLDQPTILYRQHGNNVFGTSHGFKRRFLNRINRIKRKSPYKKQAVEFFSAFGEQLSAENRVVIEEYINYDKCFYKRFLFSISPTVQMQGFKADIFQRILMLFGRA
ncbi:glycosyltransferase [Comamonas aquatica]|uniref:glycosyltransferase n=1 Tax=Comamonas aquatica TaxID=225991 RepID=UPI00244869B6|nr:glycosyltransferase [Comamonas aquatica]MDH1815220.1 glycosyltransferase [Comamonas aquatica]